MADTGQGMTPEVLHRALDPYFTTKAPGQGTGLGLALVYRAVQAHRGRLALQSEPGRGTQVQLWFPAVAVQAGTSLDRTTKGIGQIAGMALLVVDDDDMVMRTLERVLGGLGHRCTCASSGEEALGMLERGLAVDAVVLDINMPGLSGHGTLEQLRALRPSLPVVLDSGRVDQAAIDLAARFPGVKLMPKPFTAQEIQAGLEELLAGG